MPWVAAIGAVAGSLISADASGNAADAQAKSAEDANRLAQDQFNQNRADSQPWRDAGTQALGQLTSGTSAGGDFSRDFTLADFNKDPGYQFRMDQGSNALQTSAASRGGLLSGGTLKALDRYGQDYASGEYSNAYNRFNNDRTQRFNRLSSIAGLGQTATRDVAQQGTALAGQLGENGMQAANARASGYIGTANAINGGAQSLGNWYQGQQAVGNRYGGVGSSGWQAGGMNGTNDASMFSNSGNANDWFLRNGSSGD
jgi:hypothetical protein